MYNKNGKIGLFKADNGGLFHLFRITFLFLLATIGFIRPVSAQTAEAAKTITLNVQNRPIKEVLTLIERQSDYIFVYYDNILDIHRKVTLKVTNQPISAVLKQLFAGTDNTWKLSGRQIVIGRSVAAAAATPRKITRITGVVRDQNNDPLIGVTIRIKARPNIGTATDINGKYLLDVYPDEVLEFSYIGFVSIEHRVKADETTFNLRMEMDAIATEEVVVVGYGKQKKESVVSSMSTVGPAQLSVKSANLTNNIAGKLSGLIAVQRSGEPGWDDAQFFIRGISSYAGGTDPLVLVDGVPRKMNDIDVDEIETFSILKDAAATAVYGAEGANGVVLITSKRGKSQKTVVSMSAEYGYSTPLRLPNLMSSYDYLSLYNEADWNSNGNPRANYTAPVSDADLEKYRSGVDPDLYPDADWMSMLRDHTSSQRYTINFRGGGDRVRFFVSGAYYTQDGVYKEKKNADYDSNISFDRYNLRSNIDFELSKTTRMSVDMSGQYINRVAPSKTASDIFGGMTLQPVHLYPQIYSDGSAAQHPNYDNSGLRQNPYNFLYFSGYSKSWDATFQSKVLLEQDLDFITKGLSIRGSVSFDANSNQYVNRTMSPATFTATGRDADGNLIFKSLESGSALSNPSSGSSGGNKKIYIEASLNYKRNFSDKHDVTGLLLYNQKETQKQNVGGLNLLPYRKQSVVGRGSYTYDNRYTIEGSFGMTGSENFAPGHRWGIFPAVGGAWYVSHEKFFEPVQKVISTLKLRASYGRTGNDQLGETRFPYQEAMNTDAGGLNLGISGISNGNAQNWFGGLSENRAYYANLRWEIEDKTNIGFDLGLLNGQLDLSMDYFSNRRKDILITRNTVPSMSGLQSNPTQNYGIVSNKGVDGNLTFKQHVGGLNLTFRANYTYAKNKIVETDEIKHRYSYQDLTGMSLWTPYLYIADGLYTPDDFNITIDPVSGAESYQLKPGIADPGAAVAPGDIKYRDLNEDGLINDDDKTYRNGHLDKTPRSVYGLSLNAEWKGFFAGIFFQGVTGCSINLMSKASNFMPFNQGKDASSARMEAMNRWKASDPYNDNVLYPRLRNNTFAHNLQASTWWYRDASFIRLKNVEFGYQFNKKQLKSLRLTNLRLYVQGTNLKTWDHVKYWDPELGDANSGAKYPISSTWTFGAEVTF